MRSWLLRGLIFAFGMVVLRLIQSMMITTWVTHATAISILLVVIYAIVALVWGYIDGRADAKAQPDPDRRGDLAMTWLLPGLVAGGLSGAVARRIRRFHSPTYVACFVTASTTLPPL